MYSSRGFSRSIRKYQSVAIVAPPPPHERENSNVMSESFSQLHCEHLFLAANVLWSGSPRTPECQLGRAQLSLLCTTTALRDL